MQVSSDNFILLHKHLLSILSTNNYEEEHLPEKIMQYIGMIVESEKHPALVEDFFDYFCENAGNKIIKLTLEVEPLLSVKVLSMLFINLRSEFWVSYLLCQSFITDAIQFEDIPSEEEWPEYYISLLKSLTIRLHGEQLSLFFNKKFAKFPLLYESLKYYNHPDCMVRTNVMNIILGVMRIKDARLSKYLGRFPFTSYVLTYCCQVWYRIVKLNERLQGYRGEAEDRKALKSTVKVYYIDIIDYICYLNDLIELGPEELAHFVRNAVFTYIVMPFLQHLHPDSPGLLACSTLFLMLTLFKTINDDIFKTNLCLLLMGRKLPKIILAKIDPEASQQQIYIPQVYSEDFNPGKYYWNKYDYQVEKQCMKLFQDISNFETEHDSKSQDLAVTAEFEQEISRISQSIGFDILSYGCLPGRVPMTEISSLLNLPSSKQAPTTKYQLSQQDMVFQDNYIRENILGIWARAVKCYDEDSTVECISVLVNNLATSETLTNKVLQFCGLLLPRLDTKNYGEDYNKASLGRIRQIGLSFIRKINQGHKLDEEKEEHQVRDEDWFRVGALQNQLILFIESVFEGLSTQEEGELRQFYRNSCLEVKELVNKRNMKTLVESFEFEYTIMLKQAFVHSITLPQAVLLPRKGVKQILSEDSDDPDTNCVSKRYFKNSKEKLIYKIRKFSFAQNLYLRYSEHKAKGKVEQPIGGVQRYNVLYFEKYCRVESEWKLGQSYCIGFRHMVQCYGQEKKIRNGKKYLIVEDRHNMIVVEPSSEENTARIVVNHPWKYVEAEIDRETGKKMTVKLTQALRGQSRTWLFFSDELTCAKTLEWMNSLKYERYQSEQAFILGYLKECLARV